MVVVPQPKKEIANLMQIVVAVAQTMDKSCRMPWSKFVVQCTQINRKSWNFLQCVVLMPQNMEKYWR